MQITAAVLRAGDQPYSLEQVDLADPRPDEVLVRIVGAGMCHTDLLPRGAATISPPPIVCGHEGAGVVEAVGSEVEGVAVGDHVVLSYESCGACEACQADRPYACEQFWLRNLLGRRADLSTGITDASGAEIPSRWFGQSSFATHCVATARNVVVVDPALPLERLGPLGCGIQTGAGTTMSADALDVQPGTSIVVFGAGAVGLSALMGAVVQGASTIVAVDLHQSRLDLAAELGATHTILGDDPDLAGRVLELTGGAGCHYAVDTTGNPAVARTAMGCVRLGGRGALVGAALEEMAFDTLSVTGKTVFWVLEGNAKPQTFIPRLLELWQADRFPFDRMIEEFPLDRIQEAEEASLSGRVVKPVLRP
jgi:aryl-alcohol dehydrogenase